MGAACEFFGLCPPMSGKALPFRDGPISHRGYAASGRRSLQSYLTFGGRLSLSAHRRAQPEEFGGIKEA